jgi:hypothetical protein
MFAEGPRRIALIIPLLFSCAHAILAQSSTPTPQPTPLTAPPPLRTIPKTERSQLEGASDPKQRVRLTIEFATVHLTTAEKYTAQSSFETASQEVGTYHALMQNVLTFLATLKTDSNKTRDLYKRLELALRADGPRLTSMRRTTPLDFAVWIKQSEDFAREGRTEALNSFYGHTVVRDPTKTEEKLNDKPKETPTPKSQQP